MKTNMTHGILVAVSKEASKRGFKTALTYSHDEWRLTILRAGRCQGMLIIGHETKISDIEEWMKEQEDES